MTSSPYNGSISVSRVTMEDNMFDPQQRPPIPTIQIDSCFANQERKSLIEKLNGIYTPTAIIIQLIAGVLGNSLTLVADATRIFSDHLEIFEFDRANTPGKRLVEILTIGITTIVVFILFVAYLLSASGRAATMDFDISRIYLIVGTAIAITTNTVQTMGHFKTWKSSFRGSENLYTHSRRNQLLHGYGYHFFAYFNLISSFLIIVDKDYLLADIVTTYIVCILILSNILVIGYRLYKEYFLLEHPQNEYEEL